MILRARTRKTRNSNSNQVQSYKIKFQTMNENQKHKPYDLEERTFQFAKHCREFVKFLPRTAGNFEDSKQLIRSSGSVHANFIESVEALSKKNSLHRMKICRKEAKESRSWLRLVDIGPDLSLAKERDMLVNESVELMRIFGSIVSKKE